MKIYAGSDILQSLQILILIQLVTAGFEFRSFSHYTTVVFIQTLTKNTTNTNTKTPHMQANKQFSIARMNCRTCPSSVFDAPKPPLVERYITKSKVTISNDQGNVLVSYKLSHIYWLFLYNKYIPTTQCVCLKLWSIQ